MRLRIATLLAVLGGLLLPAAGHAADTTVTFSELGLPENTTIHDQFAAGYGVRFGDASRFGFPAPTWDCPHPYLKNGAMTGTALGIACATGSVEFPDRRFATSMEFQSEQRRVRFRLKNNTGNSHTAIVKVYGIGSATPLTTITRPLAGGATESFDYDAGGNAIIGVVVHSQQKMGYGDSGGVFLDDLIMSRDAVAPTPKFALVLQRPTAEVVEGDSVDVPLSVRRYNGSTGAVTLHVETPLPTGIASTQLLPSAAVTGSESATLRITTTSPFNGARTLRVSATAASPSAGTSVDAGPLEQRVTGTSALYLDTTGRLPIRLAPGCGLQAIDDGFGVRGSYSGSVGYGLDGTSALARTQSGGPVAVSGPGSYPIAYSLDPGNRDGSGAFQVALNPSAATPVTMTLHWVTDRLTIHDVQPASVALPLITGGSTVHVIGNFPVRCPVKFLDGAGQEWSVRERGRTAISGDDDLTLDVPATAVSGPLRAVNGSGVEMARTAPIDVREFRRSYGLRVANGGDNAKGTYSWADFERTFGTEETELCAGVCMHDPIAATYYLEYQAVVGSGGGLCYGYAVMAARFRGYGTGQKPSDYTPGAATAWDITPFADGTPIKRDVVRWFVTQWDKGTYDAYEAGKGRGAADERKLLKAVIAKQGSALVAIRQGASGHALTAYGVRDTADGGMIVSVYDSNIPFRPDDELVYDDERARALTRSEITVGADGSWSYPGLGWKGPNDRLIVAPDVPPTNATISRGLTVVGVAGTSAAGGPPAAITAIESGGRAQLAGDGEPRPGAAVDIRPALAGMAAAPDYLLRKGREYELTIRGTGSGTYASSLLNGSATAAVRGADTARGQVDRVAIRPGTASLRFASGAARAGVSYDLVAKRGKVTRTASIALTARKGGEDEAVLSGGTVRLVHEGAPTTTTVTLGSVGAGLPSSATTAPIKIGRDQRLDLSPRSWSSLSGRVPYTLRTKRGRVIRRGAVRVRSSGRVAFGKVTATRKRTTVTVTGTVAKGGQAASLAAVATVRKGGKTIRRKAATLRGTAVKKGRFALKIAVGRVPRGARITVDAVLADPTAGGATAVKRVRVR